MLTLWNYIQLNRGITNGTLQSLSGRQYLRPFGISKDGILEINFTNNDFVGILPYNRGYEWEFPLTEPNICLEDISDFAIINNSNNKLRIRYSKNQYIAPYIDNCNHIRTKFSYRYINPVNVDNNLLRLPYWLFPFVLLNAYFTCYFFFKMNDIQLSLAAFIKCISLLLFSILWLNEYLINNFCEYLEHIYPIGCILYYIISMFSLFNDPNYLHAFNIIFITYCIFSNYLFYFSLIETGLSAFCIFAPVFYLLYAIQGKHYLIENYYFFKGFIIEILIYYATAFGLLLYSTHFIFRFMRWEIFNILIPLALIIDHKKTKSERREDLEPLNQN